MVASDDVPLPDLLVIAIVPPSASTRSMSPRSPEPFRESGSPDAVVANRQTKIGTFEFNAHAYFRRLRVLGHVGECFCHNVVRGHFGSLGQPPLDSEVELRPGPRSGGPAL